VIRRLGLILLAAAFVAATAQVQGDSITITTLGEIHFTGDFTLNHNYNYNDPSAFPFGRFGPLTVQSATGFFAPNVNVGDTLTMNTQFMFGPINPISWMVSQPMDWSIGGFMIDTKYVLITGADSGRNVAGIIDLSGHGFDPSAYGVPPYVGANTFWDFTAPPFDITDFPSDITGPITITLDVQYVSHIPDGGGTLGLLAISTFGLLYVRRRMQGPCAVATRATDNAGARPKGGLPVNSP
jgi:hypothetical protein